MLRTRVKSSALNLTVERSLDNRSLLENAIFSGKLDTMELALSLNPPAYDSGALCAVVLAAAHSAEGIQDILQKILQRREPKNQHGSFFDPVLENTAISIAAYHGRLDIISLLQKYSKCEINTAVLPTFDYFRRGNRPGIFSTLETRIRLDITSCSEESCDTKDGLSWYESYKRLYQWHHPNRRLTSPLYFAVKSGSEVIIEKLLEMGYRPDAHSLQAALYQNVPLELESRLIEKCKNTNAFQAIRIAYPFTPVYLAAMLGRLDLMKRMLADGANLNAVLPHIRSAILGLLIECGKFDAVDILLENGIDIKTIPGPGEPCEHTALAVAARIGHLGILRRLLECHVDPNAIRVGENSAIVAAASHGRLDAVQLLLHHGAGKGGRGQLHCILAVHQARRAGYSAVVQLLESHQPWPDDNEKILNDLKKFNCLKDLDCFVKAAIIDYDKDTGEDINELLAFADKFCMVVVETGSGVACRVMGWAKEARQEIIPYRQKQLSVDPDVVASGGRTRGDFLAKQVPAVMDSGAEVSVQQSEPGLLDEASLSDRDLDDDGGMLDTEMWYEDARNEPENIPYGPHGMAEEDTMKYQSLLKDMLGEEEMPFEPVEQPW
ncbi:ankyrin repeat-containing domain protein [Hypoxylon rubiginosum]|uniref:Ankyrin repeat-containing domain protein n=1 Tax=Hypoxylon rubiginosum TaxID=110542 RepID=A0ACC0DBV4_9PEZI|nr:ankyrin repeat-containing domain protein [Hypoxylon rubiginosum]